MLPDNNEVLKWPKVWTELSDSHLTEYGKEKIVTVVTGETWQTLP